MKKKNLLLCLCMALVFTASTAVMTSCVTPDDSSSSSVQQQEDFGQDGTYYNTADDASELVLSEGDYTLTIGGETKTGKYSYDGDTFVFVDGATITNATYADGVLVFTYNDVTYKFIEKVNYTVTFKVDGEVAGTQTVINGKKATAPTAPSKDNYAFVGWYKDANYKNAFNLTTDVVSSDMTLYARFVELGAGQEYAVTYVVDGEVFATKPTISGGVYELPTPTKADATFAGWWTSAYGDVNKLTEQVKEGMQIEEPMTVYAVWATSAPLVSVSENSISWKLEKAAQVTLKVKKNDKEVFSRVLNAASYDYDFSAQESGDYVVEVTANGVTGKAYYQNKALAKVNAFSYEGSVLAWQPVKNATKYLVSVECGDPNHMHVDEEVTTNSFDFTNCAMKMTGIKFTVKAVADGYITSVSDTFTVVKNLDDVANLVYNQATAQFTWDAVANATSYKVVVNNQEFTLTTNSFDAKDYAAGNLSISVTPVAFGYNSPAAATTTASKTTLPAPQNISLTGSVVTWDKVDSATGYIVTVDGRDYTVSTNSFDVLTATNIAANATSCTVTVKAKGATDAQNSMASVAKTVGFGVMSDSLTYENGKVVWEPVINAKKFEVRVNGGSVVEANANALSADVAFTKAGTNLVEVRCYNQANVASDWISVEVEVYAITFDYGVALVNVPTQYKAAGDTFTIPEMNPETPGYEFQGWFNKANNGIKFETEQVVFNPENGTTVYANWQAKTYTLSYTIDGLAFNIDVTYGQPYKLPVINREYVGDALFGGWWSELNGQGIQYTDNSGKSIGVWDMTQDTEVFAYEIEPYEYVEVTSVATGLPGYSVKAGADIGKMTEIKIPAYYNGLPVIGIEQMGFASCGHLTKISIPDTIETIFLGLDGPFYGTGSAFYQCSSITEIEVYEVAGNHQRFYKDIDGALVRMTDYNGVELVCVPSAWQLDEYRIPDEVTTLTTNLFRSSKYLKKIIVPNTVTRIDSGAFYYCKMTELVFEEGGDQPLTIGAGAFKSCEFTSLTLPARMTEVEDSLGNMFMYCSYLTEINIEEGNQYYTSREGFVYDITGETLLYAPRGMRGTVTIPNGTKTIASESFYYYANSTSDYCRNITKIIIPIGVEEIGARAFKGSSESALTEVEFRGGENDAKINIGEEAFYGTILSSLTLPANTGEVGTRAFGSIKTLGSVRVEAGEGFTVKTGAFGDTSNNYYVTNVYLGKNVHVFDVNGAFGPTKLSTIEIHPENTYLKLEEGVLFDYDITQIVYYPASKTGNYTIPNTIEIIGGNVFNGKSLEEVAIPFTVKEIGAAAFANCARLTKVTFLTSTDPSAEHPGLVIGDQAFQNDTKLATFVLPSYTKTIGARAFESCESLTGTFKVNEGVTEIGDAAFRYASGIVEIELPKSLVKLVTGTEASNGKPTTTYPEYYRTFIGCDSLTSIKVAMGNEKYVTIDGILYGYDLNGVVTDLITCPSGYAINGGKAVIPGTVRNIWAYAFYKNVALQEVSFAEVVLAEGETVATVNISVGKSAFEEAKGLNRAVLGTGLTKISDYMFKNCSALEYVFIPNTVSEISYGQPFTGCYELSEIDFEEGNESNALVIKGSNSPNNAYTGSSAFYKLTSLTSIVFPKRTKEIGNMAFVDCTNLEYVYVPNTVTTVGNWLFGYGSNTKYTTGCPNLKLVEFQEGNDELGLTIGQRAFEGSPITSITLPKRTTKIDQYAFAGSKITSITIPEGVTSIGNYAFQYCENLKEIVLEGTSTITSIGDYAFASCAIKTFEIPATVQTIGQYAFAYTEEMETITFAENSQLKEIKNYAFRQTGVSELELPESTNNITLGTDLFQYCPNLKEVYLSSSVTAINDTFGHCGSLQRVIVDENNQNFKVDGNALYNQNKTAIQYLFESANVDEEGVYRIADGVTEIGTAAFRGQVDIKKLIIPASVSKIGKYAFRYCVNLEEIEFDLADSQLSEIAESAFEGCSSLKSVKLPVSVKTLGKYAFASCTSLANVEMNGVATLGGYTFYQCTSLKEIDLKSVSKAGAYDFSYSGLTKVHVPAMTGDTYMFYYAQDLAEVTFDENVTALGGYMFRGCKSLTEIDIPEGVTSLGTYAFAQTGITSFEFKNPSVTTGNYLFYGCTNLKTVKLVEGMTKLTTGLFYGCSSLGADMPDNVSAVELPSTLTTAYAYVFYGCSSMKMIEFPAGITEFGNTSKWSTSTASYIFQDCTSLKKVVLPATLERMGQYAFMNCTSLKEVENTGSLKSIWVSAFRNTGLEKITLPVVDSLKGYAFADNAYLKEIHLNDNLAAIDYNAFMNCTSLESIQLPSMLTLLGSTSSTGNGNVFQGCTALKSITLPRGISEIRKYTFEGCTSLEEVNFEGQIVTISPYAFANCTSLTKFTWTDYLSSIQDSAFANSGIKEVKLSASTSSVSETAFMGCPIEKFEVAEGNVYYKVINNVLCDYITEEWMLVLPGYKAENGKLVINKDNILKIAENATPFAGNTTITEIEITADAGWTEIPYGLFYDMKNLTKVTLPEGVEVIADYAFEACSKLTTVNLPSTLKDIGAYAFYGCEALTGITLNEGLEVIGEYAFAGTKLASIEVPGSVKTIERYAFYGIEELATVTLNEGLELIGGQAFAGAGITEVTIPASVTKFGSTVSVNDINSSGNTTTSNQTRSFVFAECTKLQKVTFLGSAVELTGSTFKNCTSLTTVVLPEGLKMIEDYMFYGCTSLTNVDIPDTVETIGGYAFANSGITSISIPASVMCIGKHTLMTDPYQTGSTTGQTNGAMYENAYPNGHVFMGCTNLTEVIFEGNVEQIGWYAFEGCTALETITLPNSVEIIGDYAFANCTSLKTLNVPTSTMFIGKYAFADTAITSVELPSTAIVYEGAFSGWTAEQTVNVKLSAYKAWSIWSLTWNKGTNANVVWDYKVAV